MSFSSNEEKNKTVFADADVERQIKVPNSYSCTGIDVFNIRVIRIDKCQYLVGIIGYGYSNGISSITHKADCDNPAHLQ